ncbi:hypothetical protein D8B46_07450 [Candidatus Gracilibacteria bacterium]|nr:MAG: hypothetical protein D8B46_07450 [Candidatus Gracilibacteria bacterium]
MKKIYLIDGNSFIYRMFFALPEFSTKDGKIVNAIFGMAKFFVNTLVKEKPDYLVFIKDAVGPNFREEIYADYKATRDRMPDNLRSQIDDISKMISMLKIDIVEVAGYEADDVLGTLATKFKKDKNNQVFILSGDKDLFSLISENVFVYDTMKKIVFDSEKTVEKFGVKPEMIIDYLAICGDKADNIPGIEGFGPKKAVDLINQIGGVESIYKEVKKIESGEKTASDYDKSVQSCFKGKTFEKLQKSKEDAFLSLKLATIDLNVNLENFDLENFKFEPEKFKNDEVIAYFKEMEFNSLLEEGDFAMKMTTWKDLNLNVKIIGNDEFLKKIFEEIKKYEKIVLDTETTSLDVMQAKIVGVSFYLDEKNIFYINRLHKGPRVSDLELKKFFKNLFELNILIIGHNLKYDLEVIENFLKNDEVFDENSQPTQIVLDI